MKELFAILYVLLITWMEGEYFVGVIKKKISPTPLMWLICEIGISMSLVTYFTSHQKHDLVSNVANTIDIVGVTTIFVAILIKCHWTTWNFSKLQWACLSTSITVLAWGLLKGNSQTENAAFQILMVVAYLPLYETLWIADENPEPVKTWICFFLAAVLSFMPAAIGRDKLAMIYTGRAILMTTIALALMWRLERRRKQRMLRTQDPSEYR